MLDFPFRLFSLQYYRRKFRSQTSDNIERWKAEQGRGREKRKIRREKIRRERVRRKKMQMREKVGKSRNTVFFPMICGSGGSKSRLAKAAGAEPAGQMRDEKSARRCGAKHICKSKCTKHTMVGPLLEVEMSKKCTPLWREAHFQVKMYKALGVWTTFGGCDVEKVHTVVARSTFASQNVQNTRGSDHFWRFRCRFAASLHYTTLRYIAPHSTILHYITLHYTPQHYNYTTRVHSTTLH